MGANQSEIGFPLKDPDEIREKKRKWWKRRNSKAVDPGRFIREIIGSWSAEEILNLVEEYEKLFVEKEVWMRAESARVNPQNVRTDLADLLDFKWNSDVNLILPPAIFPAHRAVLMQRSKYFRTLLSNNRNGNVNVELPVDVPTFSSLLRFLYTEEASGNLVSLANEFGMPERLEGDLRDLLSTSKYSDVILLFGDEQYPCHKSILAARSPFFRSLLQRRSNSKKIVLDESIIPKRYARVLLQCMYIDKVDLALIDPSRSGLTEVESLTFTGRVNPAGFEEAMELFQIGRFLEFDMLCQNCEDIIVESLNVDILPSVLNWSCRSYGSPWVRRQALLFLREEFLHITAAPSFLDVDKLTLHELLHSDFIQASETDILQAVIKWGEQQLIRRVEEREPNVVNQTRDSVARKGIKRRDMSDSELRDIIGHLLKFIRIDQLSSDAFQSLVRRGLISLPPSELLTDEVRMERRFGSSRPRLYTPFYEEAKAALKSRASELPPRRIPFKMSEHHDPHEERTGFSLEAQMVIDPEILNAMNYREKKLRNHCKNVTRNVWRFIRLRVVREFGFPDSVAELVECGGGEGGNADDLGLCERMPDVAIAASDLKSIRLDDVVDLDLGDRACSQPNSTLGSSRSRLDIDVPRSQVVRYHSYTNVGPPHYL